MNLLNKASLLAVASLLVTDGAFAQDRCGSPPKKCEEMKPVQLVAGYNAPSRIDVRGCWDVYASGSFTYWQPIQDNMEVGAVVESSGINSSETIVNQDFGYKPGFKVALGMNFDYDNWDTMIQYTWFRGSETTKIANEDNSNRSVKRIGQSKSFSEAVQDSSIHMDFVDWDLGRNYYVGTKLTFRTALGARAAWIRQAMKSQFNGVNSSNETVNDIVAQTTHSWGVGPRVAINSNWNLGEGFRIFGNTGFATLFTQYPKAEVVKEEVVAGTLTKSSVSTQTDINCLRPQTDVEIGLGWGTYFDCYNWHFDCTLGYGFQMLFNENMFRNANSSLPNGDLYVHGVTLSARLDF